MKKFGFNSLLTGLVLCSFCSHSYSARLAYYGIDYEDLGKDLNDLKGLGGAGNLKDKLNEWTKTEVGKKFSLYTPDLKVIDEEVPADVLLLVVSLSGESIQRYQFRDVEQKFFGLNGNLLLVDPMTGATIFSLSRFYYRSDWDENGLHRTDSGYDSNAISLFRSEIGSQHTTRVFQGKVVEENVSDLAVFEELIELAGKRIIEEFVSSYTTSLLEMQCAFNIAGKQDTFLVNKGRDHGVFKNTLIYSPSSGIRAKIIESHENYAYAVALDFNKRPEKWETFRTYLSGLGNKNSNVLVGVTRVLYSPASLNVAEIGAHLKADEEFLELKLKNSPATSEQIVRRDLQALYTTALTDALVAHGTFKMAFPVAALRNLNRAKGSMRTEMNLKTKEDGVPFEESLVLPDLAIAAVVSGVSKHETMVDYAQQANFDATIDLYLYDLLSYDVIASSSTPISKSFRFSALEEFNQNLFVENMLLEGVQLAAKELSSAYSETSCRIALQSGGNESPIDACENLPLYEGKILISRELLGRLELSDSSEEEFDIFINSNPIRIFRDDLTGGFYGESESKILEQSEIYAYGINAPPENGVYGRPVAIDLQGALSASGESSTQLVLLDMLLSVLADNPNYQAFLPEPYIGKLKRFASVKLVKDLQFRESAKLNLLQTSSDTSSPSEGVYVGFELKKADFEISDRVRALNQITLNQEFEFSITFKDVNTQDSVFNPIEYKTSKPRVMNEKDFNGDTYAKAYLENIIPKILGLYYTKKLSTEGKQ